MPRDSNARLSAGLRAPLALLRAGLTRSGRLSAAHFSRPRYASCDTPEEKWQRDLPSTGEKIYFQLGPGHWSVGSVFGLPKEVEFRAFRKQEAAAKNDTVEAAPEPVVAVSANRQSHDQPAGSLACLLLSERAFTTNQH